MKNLALAGAAVALMMTLAACGEQPAAELNEASNVTAIDTIDATANVMDDAANMAAETANTAADAINAAE